MSACREGSLPLWGGGEMRACVRECGSRQERKVGSKLPKRMDLLPGDDAARCVAGGWLQEAQTRRAAQGGRIEHPCVVGLPGLLAARRLRASESRPSAGTTRRNLARSQLPAGESTAYCIPCLTAHIARLSNTRPQAGQVAQLVEQRIENPRVVGSIPTLATTPFLSLDRLDPVGRFHVGAKLAQVELDVGDGAFMCATPVLFGRFSLPPVSRRSSPRGPFCGLRSGAWCHRRTRPPGT